MSSYILRSRTWQLPDMVLAEQLLAAANISADHQLLIRTAVHDRSPHADASASSWRIVQAKNRPNWDPALPLLEDFQAVPSTQHDLENAMLHEALAQLDMEIDGPPLAVMDAPHSSAPTAPAPCPAASPRPRGPPDLLLGVSLRSYSRVCCIS